MLRYLWSLFKKPKPKKIIEVIEYEDKPLKKETHYFQSFNEKEYCSIIGYEKSSLGQGFQSIKIAWRNPKRVNVGDFLVINSKDTHKTLRLVKILNENEDVKLGIANMLK
jgi:hypothetical protein